MPGAGCGHLRQHRPRRRAAAAAALIALSRSLGSLPSSFTAFSSGSRLRGRNMRQQPHCSRAFGFHQADTSSFSDGILRPGDRVEAFSFSDSAWYPGTVVHDFGDSTFRLRWDEPSGDPAYAKCRLEEIRSAPLFEDYKVNETVVAYFPHDDAWYNGSVHSGFENGTFLVEWDDPDGGPMFELTNASGMRKVPVLRDYRVGQLVEAMYPADGYWADWKRGYVIAHSGSSCFKIAWEETLPEEESSWCIPRYMKPVACHSDLQVGDRVDAKCPIDNKWYPGYVAQLLRGRKVRLKWQDHTREPAWTLVEVSNVKGLFRDYIVGDDVEALYPEEGTSWRSAVVIEDCGDGAFKVKWHDPGDMEPVAMRTPEEMYRLEDTEEPFDASDWYEDEEAESAEQQDGDFEEQAAGDVSTMSDIDGYHRRDMAGPTDAELRFGTSFRRGADDPVVLALPTPAKTVLLSASMCSQAPLPSTTELLPQPCEQDSSSGAWEVLIPSTLRLTLRPRLRGQRRSWRRLVPFIAFLRLEAHNRFEVV
eukprot:TRINITY_DN36451_c0_g1_i1.p1 TRINITY_DN36451_c0_g1~~TRINITY_DN36451_c0_g1_i1.p1  ORF type:complete len:533 (+),score=108.42 TRINITY_DN36451_c0_g1_i1:208-1806(+)